jgi:curli biogenesis system outer membrane secretion channel CsgG
MTRRLVAVLAVAFATAGPLASSASAAYCGPVVDQVGSHLPAPASSVYWRVCGP